MSEVTKTLMNTNKVQEGNRNDTGKTNMVNGDTVSQGEINAWKAMFPHVYKTTSGKQAFIYRPVTRSEYTRLMLDTDIDPNDELDIEKRVERLSNRQVGICRIAVLWPAAEKLNDLLESHAGLASNLSDEIMDHSGFNALSRTEEL